MVSAFLLRLAVADIVYRTHRNRGSGGTPEPTHLTAD